MVAPGLSQVSLLPAMISSSSWGRYSQSTWHLKPLHSDANQTSTAQLSPFDMMLRASSKFTDSFFEAHINWKLCLLASGTASTLLHQSSSMLTSQWTSETATMRLLKSFCRTEGAIPHFLELWSRPWHKLTSHSSCKPGVWWTRWP